MGKIRPLSEALIGKIAAGEVVERPAAAIKELVENSLDAGATAVTVEIQEGGLGLIRVTDNGCGIDEADLRMAFERHATSKISREQDLTAIHTLGFRGEALASIAAVSRVTLTTRTADRQTGLRVVNEGGKILSINEAGGPVGTAIRVEDLFYNVPVRRGFMKKPGQEAGLVTELMTRLILSKPDVSFRYLAEGKTVLRSPGDGKLGSALQAIYGNAAARTFRPVDDHGNGVLIRGYLGVGENARGNRNHEFFFINGRVMQSRLLCEAVETGCRERVMIGKFPVCALHLTLPYESVDVNVHPNKLEVRFRDEAGVYEAVMSAVVLALQERDAFERPVEMKLTKEKPQGMSEDRNASAPSQSAQLPQPRVTVRKAQTLPLEAALPENAERTKETPVCSNRVSSADPSLSSKGPSAIPSENAFPVRQAIPMASASVPVSEADSVQAAVSARIADTAQPAVPAANDVPSWPPSYVPDRNPVQQPRSVFFEERAEQLQTELPGLKKPMRIFGALFNTFILIEYQDQLLLVDQHAVHERLLFDKLMREHSQTPVMGQELLMPLVISLTNREQRLLEENSRALESIGMVVEAFGEQDVIVRTIPVILGEAQTRDFVQDVLAELQTGKDPTYEKKRTALLQTACKHAVKGGEPLSESQLRDLLDRMIEQKVTPTCPHGRPLVVSISHRELDKKFKRIQL